MLFVCVVYVWFVWFVCGVCGWVLILCIDTVYVSVHQPLYRTATDPSPLIILLFGAGDGAVCLLLSGLIAHDLIVVYLLDF